jgi:hypothetical protein
MNEADWQSCTDPTPLQAFLLGRCDEQPKWSERQKRLFMCACCRRVWSELSDELSRQAVVAAERYVEGTTSIEKLEAAGEAALRVSAPYWDGGGFDRRDPRPYSDAAFNVTVSSNHWGAAPLFLSPDRIIREAVTDRRTEEAAQSDLLREIVGNPFRPVQIDPCWLTSDVLALTGGIYEERAFDRMPILADALQDAGCDSDDILSHCRDANATHVRGCWVVDLLLGKN